MGEADFEDGPITGVEMGLMGEFQKLRTRTVAKENMFVISLGM